MKQPIFEHRQIIGYASTVKQAERVIRKTLTIHPRATLRVFQRNTELIDLPAGFVFSIAFEGRK